MTISPKQFFGLCFLLLSFVLKSQSHEVDKFIKAYPLSEYRPFENHLLKHKNYLYKNLDSAEYYLNQAESNLNRSNDLDNMVYLYNKSVYKYRISSDYDDIIKDCKKGLELAERLEYPFYKIKFYIILSLCSSNDTEQSYKYNQIAYNLAKTHKVDEELIGIVFNMAVSEEANGNYEYAKKHLLEIRSKLITPVSKLRYYLLFASVVDQLDEALLYVDSGETIADTYNLSVYKEHIYAQKADLYNKSGCYNEALAYFQKRDELHKDDPNDQYKHQYSFVRSRIYYNMGDYKKAKQYFDMYRSSQFGNMVQLDSSPDFYAYELHKALQDTAKAFVYLENWELGMRQRNEIFRDSLYQVYRSKFELDKTQEDLLAKDSEIKFYKIEIVFLFMGFVIILLLIFIIFQVKHMREQKEILETQLRLDNEKKMNEIRKHFIENITHEIRTPITLIQGVFENFMQSNYDNKELMDIGLKNTKQLAYDMEQILEFLKTDSTVNPVINKKIHVLPFFLDVINSFKVNLFSKGLKLIFTHNLTEESFITSDQNKLTMILSNYLSNAIKFSNTATKIHLRGVLENKYFIFSITDFGYNLSQSELPFVFDRFFRGSSNKNNIGGHGIGLSICMELSKLLDGEVYVEVDDETKSTTFYFKKYIGIETRSNDYKLIEFSENEPSTHLSEFTNTLNPKVLLVDDNELMIRFYRNVLSPFYDCDYVYNGKDALEKIKKQTYSCLILDVMMPEMDGFELLKHMKALYPNKEIPTIFVTAKDFDETRHEAFHLGIHDFVSKPFVLQELLARISNVIKNASNLSEEQNIKEELKLEVDESQIVDDKFLLNKVINLVEKHMGEEDFSVERLATWTFYSQRHFSRKIKQLTGLSPRELILDIRLKKAYQLLKHSQSIRISDVQKIIGIKSTAHFNKVFKQRFGVTPKQIRSIKE